jgi:signal transduction histidine kinase
VSYVQNLANLVELQNQVNSRDYLLNYFKQNTKDGLLIFNEKLQAIYINEAVNELAGKKFNQFPISLAETINYFHPDDLNELILIINESIDLKKEKLRTQYRAFSAEQKTVWIESNFTFSYNSSREFQNAFVISRNITKTIKLAEELKEISERRKNIAELLIEEREKNKEELYTELHDGINQLLFVAKLNIENSGLKDVNLVNSVSKLKIAIEHIRKIALESTTQFVFGDYFVSSLTDYILGFNNSTIKFRVETDIHEPYFINDQSKKHIFRIVQQLVQFSTEISKASRVVFRFKQIESDFLILAIDNGIYNCNTLLENLNLKSIHDRIYLLDGKMRFFNLEQKGLIVYIKLRVNE